MKVLKDFHLREKVTKESFWGIICFIYWKREANRNRTLFYSRMKEFPSNSFFFIECVYVTCGTFAVPFFPPNIDFAAKMT